MAKGSGRRSLADLNAAQFSVDIQPTRKLRYAERKVWDRVMGAWPDKHWIASDTDLLTQYCSVCVLFEKLREAEDIKGMDTISKLCQSLATKLRLTPQARYDTRTAASRSYKGEENEAAADKLLGGSIAGVETGWLTN